MGRCVARGCMAAMCRGSKCIVISAIVGCCPCSYSLVCAGAGGLAGAGVGHRSPGLMKASFRLRPAFDILRSVRALRVVRTLAIVPASGAECGCDAFSRRRRGCGAGADGLSMVSMMNRAQQHPLAEPVVEDETSFRFIPLRDHSMRVIGSACVAGTRVT